MLAGCAHPLAAGRVDVGLAHREVKLALEPLAADVKYDERRMLSVLRTAGIEPNFSDHGKALKPALKRYVMYLQRDTRRAWWAGTQATEPLLARGWPVAIAIICEARARQITPGPNPWASS